MDPVIGKSKYVIDNTAAASDTVLWTSSKSSTPMVIHTGTVTGLVNYAIQNTVVALTGVVNAQYVSTNQFTVPTSGVYIVWFKLLGTTTNTQTLIWLNNGAKATQFYNCGYTNGRTGNTVVACSAGDKLWFTATGQSLPKAATMYMFPGEYCIEQVQ